jgi:hypothetical protein
VREVLGHSGRDATSSTLREDTAMTSLRQRMIRDMNLAGFAAGTQRAYINGVVVQRLLTT